MKQGLFKGFEFSSKALKPFIQFMWASDLVRSRVHSHLNQFNITVSQFGVLDALFHLGPMSQKELGKKILKTSGNITMVIDNLEKNTLVQRVRNEKDRRFFTIHITAKGKTLFKKIMPDQIQAIEKQLGKLTNAEQEELGRLCVKLGRE
ncbi:MAG: MarR family transcriptional regulator [Nitrospira sp.]|nr:MarR family transcriptional regulator [bacterium]MBL7050207.1 MarR family transcriptional regulator [Nitrospira sp.]